MRFERIFKSCRWGAAFSVAVLSVGGGVVGIDPCSLSTVVLAVESTSDASSLASLLNCSGGTFDVEWRGRVIVNETIAVMAGSSLTIVGDEADNAIADGNGTLQLFTVVGNSSLNITRMSFVGGRVSAVDGSVHGGAIYAKTSFVNLHDTTFLRNHAGDSSDGGAISALDSQITLSGDTVFEENTAKYGGAIDTNRSPLTWSGNTSFSSNAADEYGGAIRVWEGELSWSGETHFSGNKAIYGGGGAIEVKDGSNVSWSGYTTFSENIADSLGGAMYINDASGTWTGNTSFRKNKGFIGGALYLSTTNISFEGFNSFINNTVQQSGGAIGLDSSNITWTGETRFVGNTAKTEHAGALFISGTTSQTISCDGLTEFINNTALQLGGAISDNPFDVSESGEQLSTLTFVGGSTTNFYRNQAGTNGGALAFGGRYSLEFDTGPFAANVSFQQNSAETAGGAVYQSGVSRGFTWRNVSFVANYAQIGGAVYSLASGTGKITIDDKEVDAKMEFINTRFQENEASTSGGAVESVAGKDTFRNSRFEGNRATLGGALRLAGASELIGCEFIQNRATDSAAAVSNAGLIEKMENISFEKNILLCNIGMFFDYNVKEDFYPDVCQGCPACGFCAIDVNGSLECTVQLEHTTSIGEGVTMETLEIDKGYWRATNTSDLVLPCYNTEACVGGITGNPEYCDDGYDGPYCSTCTRGYAKTTPYTCNTCDSKEGLAFAVIVLAMTMALCAALVAYMVVRVDHNNMNNNISTNIAWARLLRVAHRVPFNALKIIIVSWQILTQFDTVANITYPSLYEDFLGGLSSIVGLELGTILSTGCVIDFDFHGRLLFSTLGPLMALGIVGVTCSVAVYRNRDSQEAIQRIKQKHASMALLITFLVYSSVSSTVFRMFACEGLDDGNIYLRSDYNIECDSRQHRALQVYAGIMIFVYPVGIPALYAFLRFANRGAIKDGHRREHGELSIYVEVMSDLWKPYTPECFYYEVVECARRIALTGIVVFIYPNTAAQVAVTLALAFIFFVVSESMAPYASNADAWMSRVGHIVVFFSMFQALLLKVDVSNERSESQEVFGGVLLAANLCMVAAFIVEALIVTQFVWNDNFGNTAVLENSYPICRRTNRTGNRVELVEL